MRTWKTPAGKLYNFHADLLQQKHLLIAGSSGSGKSVLLNGILYHALYSIPGDHPDGVEFILIDPKGVELSIYKPLPHTLKHAVDPAESVAALRYAVDITENRFKAMQRRGERIYPGGDVFVVVDEWADLITTQKKHVVPLVQRLAQIGRAARVHLILCTQCPLAPIIPTAIKCNFDSIVGLHTANAQQSRNIIGVSGCEKLPQFGNCYYTKPGQDPTLYVNIPLFSDEAIADRVKWWTCQTWRGIFSRKTKTA